MPAARPPPRKKGFVRRTVTLPFRITGAAVRGVTYPVRHPVRSTGLVFRPVTFTASTGVKAVRATTGVALYPVRHPVKSAKAVATSVRAVNNARVKTVKVVVQVWDSKRGKFVRKVTPYALAAGAGALVFPGHVAGAAAGLFAARATLEPKSISRKVAATAGKGLYAGGRLLVKEGKAAGKQMAADLYADAQEQGPKLLRRLKALRRLRRMRRTAPQRAQVRQAQELAGIQAQESEDSAAILREQQREEAVRLRDELAARRRRQLEGEGH